MDPPRERRWTARGEKEKERGKARGVKKGGRSLLTTRLIRTVLLTFYNGTFVSNTDFKKQTLLSQRRCCRWLAGWLRASARARLLSFRHSPLSSFVPRSVFFLFRARSTVKDVWQNLNCETSVGRPARKPEASSRELWARSLSLFSLFHFFSSTAASRLLIRASPSLRARVRLWPHNFLSLRDH